MGFWEVDAVFTVLWWVPEVHIQGPIRAQQSRQCLPFFLCQHCFVLCRHGDRKLSDTAELLWVKVHADSTVYLLKNEKRRNVKENGSIGDM